MRLALFNSFGRAHRVVCATVMDFRPLYSKQLFLRRLHAF